MGVILVFVVLAMSAVAAEAPPGFTTIFNGRDLTGWRGGDTFDHRTLLEMSPVFRAKQIEKWSIELTLHWRVEDGELVSNGIGRFLTTERDYGDFEFFAEYKIEPRGDSGLYLRGVPQVQLWDPNEPQLVAQGAAKGSGGLWNNKPGTPGRDPLVRADKPAGEWNKLSVRMVGSHVSVWLNGTLVVDHAILENYFNPKLPVPSKGPIQLQTHGGEMRWRNLFIREIGSVEANSILAANGRGTGWKPLWNGRDATGWAGTTGAFEVVDGAIRTRAGQSGTMYFKEMLSDFAVRLQFLTVPGGSAGLALRYPGRGDPASLGLCKIPLLDEHFEKTRGPIDARQRHASAYGLVPALRDYQRPMGEWNFQEVTVRGSTVRVDLNGYLVLDADLSAVVPAAYMRKGSKPWTIVPRGYLGIVGEGTGLAIRGLELKALPTFARP